MIINDAKYNGSGVYAIVNENNGKIYIGQSKNVEHRAYQHKTKIERGIHEIDEINKEKDDLFRIVLLQPCEIENLLLFEKAYIYEFCSSGMYLYNDYARNHDLNCLKNNVISCFMFRMGINEGKQNFCKKLNTNMYQLKKRRIKHETEKEES